MPISTGRTLTNSALVKTLTLGSKALKRFLVNSYWTLLWAAETPFRWWPVPKSSFKTALIVRVDALGDFLLWLKHGCALASQLRSDGYKVVLIGNAAWKQIANGLPEFDEVIPVDRKKFVRNLLYRWRLLREIRAHSASEAINTHFSRELAWSESVIATCSAQRRIGQEGDCSNILGWHRRLADRWYSMLLDSAQDDDETARNAHFVRSLGVHGETRQQGFPELVQAPTTLSLPIHYFVIAPGAGWAARQWPAERFAEIAKRLHEEQGWVPVICGSEQERALARRITAELAGADAVDLTGRTTLLELCAVVGGGQLVVANESGIAHLAALFDVPVVCVVGGGHYGRFVPKTVQARSTAPRGVSQSMSCFGCNWRCVYPLGEGSVVPCVEAVGVEAVWSEVSKALQFHERAGVH